MECPILIPARMGSTRLPGKLVKPIQGRSMIRRVWEQANMIVPSNVFVVGDSFDIMHSLKFDLGAKFYPGNFIKVEDYVRCGCERVALALERDPILKNVKQLVVWQGDELIDYRVVDRFIDFCLSNQLGTANLVCSKQNLYQDVDQVRVNTGGHKAISRVIWFLHRNLTAFPDDPYQVGVYYFNKQILRQFFGWGHPTHLELATSAELNRVISQDFPVYAVFGHHFLADVEARRMKLDTAEDFSNLEEAIKQCPQFPNQPWPRLTELT